MTAPGCCEKKQVTATIVYSSPTGSLADLADLAASPQDEDALAAVRLAVRKALAADPVLEAEARSMLAAPGLTQQVRAGRDAYTAGRDQVIGNYRRPGE